MPKLKKVTKEEIIAPQKAFETVIPEKVMIQELTQEFGGDMNTLRDKINEIIRNK